MRALNGNVKKMIQLIQTKFGIFPLVLPNQRHLSTKSATNNNCCAESQTLGDFGAALRLMVSDVERLRSVFVAVHNGDMTVLTSLGIKESELGDVKFFLEKLIKTGFLD